MCMQKMLNEINDFIEWISVLGHKVGRRKIVKNDIIEKIEYMIRKWSNEIFHSNNKIM